MTRHSKSPVSSGIRNIAILVAVVAVLYLAGEILIPLAFAVTLSLILAPAIGWLRKMRLGRVPAALLVLALSMAAAGASGWVIFNDLVDVANQLPEYQQNIHKKLEAIRAPHTGAVGRAAASVQALGKELAAPPTPVVPPVAGDRAGRRIAPSAASRPLAVQVVEAPTNELLYVRDMMQPFLRPLGVFGMVLIFSLFLMIGHDDLRDRLFRLAGVSQLNVTAAMLALLLEHSGGVVITFTPDPGLQQLAFVQPAADDIFCVCALPPFAFAHARTLSHQLRVRFPGIRIVVGVWGFAGETERAMERFQAPRPDQLVTSLADAIQAVLNPAVSG